MTSGHNSSRKPAQPTRYQRDQAGTKRPSGNRHIVAKNPLHTSSRSKTSGVCQALFAALSPSNRGSKNPNAANVAANNHAIRFPARRHRISVAIARKVTINTTSRVVK